MSVRNLLRKLFLCSALGGHSIFVVGMSQEKIEELLHAMHQTRIEVTISDDDEKSTRPGHWILGSQVTQLNSYL
jgi:hypothetical protein